MQIEALEKAARAGDSAMAQLAEFAVVDRVGRGGCGDAGSDAAGQAVAVTVCWRDALAGRCAEVGCYTGCQHRQHFVDHEPVRG